MAEIYMSQIKLLEDERNAKEALDGIDGLRKEELKNVSAPKKRAQMITAGLLVQHGAREHLGDQAPDGIYAVARTEKGKPYFTELPDVHFSISHSGNMALVAVSDVNVGADIQEWRELNADIAGRFFHPAEKEHLKHLTPSESEKAFFNIWCLKESYAKYAGGDLLQALEELDFTPVLEGGFAVFEFTENNDRIRAEILEAPHGYSAAVIEKLVIEEEK
ncbi:MAG: 4'-phosphopantetheinyl transferase superfamily protein [Lachnospiraceae bacterium]|nr:4'-phosphopantetheinyl transferase superfamily protein [Lachnospiraceae bacterium]